MGQLPVGRSARVIIRDATAADSQACAAIYAPYVRETTVSFELEPPTPEEMAERIAAAQARHVWLVLEQHGRVVGYAYANRFSARPAYRWSVEVSIYLEWGRQRTGGGRQLYEALLERLAERGYRRAMAGTSLPTMPVSRSIAHSVSRRSASTARSAGSTAPGATSRGCRGRSLTATTHRPSRDEPLAE